MEGTNVSEQWGIETEESGIQKMGTTQALWVLEICHAWSCEHATKVKENMIVVFYWNIHELGNKDPYLLISVLLMPSSMGLDTWKMLNEYLNE